MRFSGRKTVELFLECIRELKERPFILDGLHNLHFHIDIEPATGKITCIFDEGDQEQFRSFLVTFRKFILNDEPANIDHILNICLKSLRPEQTELREILRQFKTIWKYQYRSGTIRITSGGVNLSPQHVLDLWLNGQYFHNGDIGKTERLKELLNKDLPTVKLQLIWSLPILTETILTVGGTISKAFNESAFHFLEE
jgi:hypothetical protein